MARLCGTVHHVPEATRSTAEPITAVIAERVRSLRDAAGWSQADLAAAVDDLGVPWKRATVVNLEKRAPNSRGAGGGRDAVTVQELLALAIALDVPPPMLLADPRHIDTVPVASGKVIDAWTALLWLVGSARADNESSLDNHKDAAAIIRAGQRVIEALVELGKSTVSSSVLSDEEIQQRDQERHRDALELMARELNRLAGARAPFPDLPAEFIYKRAEELGFRWFPELPAKPLET